MKVKFFFIDVNGQNQIRMDHSGECATEIINEGIYLFKKINTLLCIYTIHDSVSFKDTKFRRRQNLRIYGRPLTLIPSNYKSLRNTFIISRDFNEIDNICSYFSIKVKNFCLYLYIKFIIN